MNLLSCGHDERYEVLWHEDPPAFVFMFHFCLACNYERVTKFIAGEPVDNLCRDDDKLPEGM
jgi:hypothetical protein